MEMFKYFWIVFIAVFIILYLIEFFSTLKEMFYAIKNKTLKEFFNDEDAFKILITPFVIAGYISFILFVKNYYR